MISNKFTSTIILILFNMIIAYAEDTVHNLPLGDPQYCWDQRIINLGDIYHTSKDSTSSWEELIQTLSLSSIVLLGESHTNYHHHNSQAQIISDLVKAGKTVVVGMEFFERSHNDILQQWTQGILTEKEFLAKTDWANQVGYHYRYYRPILEVVKTHQLPIVGLNIPRSIVHKVARKGLAGLTEEEKNLFPKINLDVQQHRYLIQRIFGEFAVATPEMFEKMYTAQCVWDVAMADSIQQSLKKYDSNVVMVVIVGSGHVIYNLGIPLRLKEMGITNWTSVIFHEIEQRMNETKQNVDPHFKQVAGNQVQAILARSLGNWILATEGSEPAPFPTLGIKLQFSNNKLEITHVAKDSIAQKMGWSKGDVILSFNEKSYTSLIDAQLFLLYLNWDDTFSWKIQRGEEIIEGEYKLLPSK